MRKYKEFNLVERHLKYKKEILEEAENQDPELVLNQVTKEGRLLYNMQREVLGCLHRNKAFTRLQINKHGILYARVFSEHFIEDYLAKFFSERFPNFVVVIGSSRGTFVKDYNSKLFVSKLSMEETIRKLEPQLEINPMLDEMEDFDENIWHSFYTSQYIKERKNLRLFHKHIPKKMLKNMEYENKLINKNEQLTSFLNVA